MRNELEYFYIDGGIGGNQDWFRDWWMRMGGCAAVAACESCISMERAGIAEKLCPIDCRNLTRESYVAFAMKMKPYLRPRLGGINKLSIFMEGMGKYLSDMGSTGLLMEGFSSDEPEEKAIFCVKEQIDRGYPIPFLLLKHQNPVLRDFYWHWFMVVGYEEQDEGFSVKTATYGNALDLSFHDLWNSGYTENGGMIFYRKK